MVVRKIYNMPIMCTNSACTGTLVGLKDGQNTHLNFDVSKSESHKS